MTAFLQVRRQYESILNEYNKLKQDESKMFTILQTKEQRCKELEENCNKMQEVAESKTKERIAGQQSRFRELKIALDKVIKTLNKNAEVIVIQYKKMNIHVQSMHNYNDSYKYNIDCILLAIYQIC